MLSSNRLGCFASSIILLTAHLAFAEPSPADKASARELYLAGTELRAKGDHAGALEKFRAAYALVPTPITALELAREYRDVGQLVEASEKYVEAAKMAPAAKESAAAKKAREDAEHEVEALTPRIPSVTIRVKGAPVESPLVIKLDGRELPLGAIGSPRKINPGKHDVVATGVGASRSTKFDIAEGRSDEVVIDISPGDGSPSVSKTPTTDAAKTTGPQPSSSPVVTIGLATAGVGAVLAVVGGYVWWSKHQALESRCSGGECPRDYDFKSDVATRNIGAGLTFAGIALAAGGTAVALVSMGNAPAKMGNASTVTVAVTPMGVLLSGEF